MFLRPDARTSSAVAQIHRQLKDRFGLIAAAAFPPHITPLGNIAITTTERDLLDRIGTSVAGGSGLTLVNPGAYPVTDGAVVCLLHEARAADASSPARDASRAAQPRASATAALARTVQHAVDPIRARTDGDYLVGHADSAAHQAHISLASQDLVLRPDLHEAVAAFVADLPVTLPPLIRATTVSAYRFTSTNWTGTWWATMTWEHLRTWTLSSDRRLRSSVARR